MVELKNIHGKKNILGQFFTPSDRCDWIVQRIGDLDNAIIIEPSFGVGNFIKSIRKYHPTTTIYGIEIDDSLCDVFDLQSPNIHLRIGNFYDFKISDICQEQVDARLVFVGNPPYRTPAYSLTTHKKYISSLRKKYKLPGIREEAIFFILHTIDLILSSKNGVGEIHYILPKTILSNNSRFFTNFKIWLKTKCQFIAVNSIDDGEFEGVSQQLVVLSLRVDKNIPNVRQNEVLVDGQLVNVDDFLHIEDQTMIPFQRIFKKTYCGSVPCESILMSVSGEPKEHFKDRLCKIMSDSNIDKRKLYNLLSFNGKYHLKVFNSHVYEDKMVQDKLDILLTYVANMREKDNIILDFQNLDNYKEINGRNEVLYYFRCHRLKKGRNFVYDLNPNPGPSFFFPGNPSSGSGDYLGYCSYDVNRNLSPGANRTVSTQNLADNLTDEFKAWWVSNTSEPFSAIFEYMIYISKTNWYKDKKRTCGRFYFGIPKKFAKKENRTIDYDFS